MALKSSGKFSPLNHLLPYVNTVTLSNALETGTPTVTVRAANMVDIISEKEIDFCGHLSGSNECPSAGDYSIETFEFQIPGNGEEWYNSYAYW